MHCHYITGMCIEFIFIFQFSNAATHKLTNKNHCINQVLGSDSGAVGFLKSYSVVFLFFLSEPLAYFKQ